MIVYAPQIDSWQDFEVISARAAFRVTANDDPVTYFGALEFKAYTDTDLAEREVLLHDLEIISLSIENLAEDSLEFGLIRDGFVAMSRKVPLDLVLAYSAARCRTAVKYRAEQCSAGDLRFRVAGHSIIR